MIDRRKLISALTAMVAGSNVGVAHAQVRRIGVIMAVAEADREAQPRLAAFAEGLAEAGLKMGTDVVLETRWQAGNPEKAEAAAKELVALAPAAILVNGTQGLRALKQLGTAIPIVFVVVTDPVGAGFVLSLSRPGANITGFSTFEPEIGGKWLQTLHEAAPQIRNVGVIVDPASRAFHTLWLAIEALAPTLGLKATAVPARDVAELDHELEAFSHQPNAGLIVTPSSVPTVHRERIFRITGERKIPAIWPFAFHARDGGLMAYGFDVLDQFRRAGPYIARILKGEAPSALPVQAPTKFEFVINQKTAKALGLTIPPGVLIRASEVIE